MNYWPAESTNLAELHEPFIDFIERVAVNGHRTAQVNYNARGWVAHHNSDIWAQSAPVGDFGKGDPVWANWQRRIGVAVAAPVGALRLRRRRAVPARRGRIPVMKARASSTSTS
jgi:hypothetical protein